MTRTQLVYFEAAGTGRADAAVRMTVYDANNVGILTLVARSGQVAGRDILLAPGTYTVRFVAANRDGSPLGAFQFRGRYNLATARTVTPTLYVYEPVTQTTATLLAPSPTYTAPVGAPSTDPVVWLAPPRRGRSSSASRPICTRIRGGSAPSPDEVTKERTDMGPRHPEVK